MTEIACPICQRSVAPCSYEQRHLSEYNGIDYKLYHCLECRIEFWYPLELSRQFYEEASISIYSDIHGGLRNLPRHCLNFFEHMPLTSGYLLDVGCGDGIFMSKVLENRKYNFDVFGLDFDSKSIERARSKYGLTNVYKKSLEEFPDIARKKHIAFDVVTFFDVLEHQDQPIAFIRSIKRLLSANGYVAGSVPNANRLFSRYDRRRSLVDLPPHHFLYFTDSSIRSLLSREGFVDITLYPVTLGLVDMIAFLSHMCVGNLANSLNARQRTLAAVSAERTSSSEMFTVRALKYFRNALFVPFAVALLHIYNRRGPQLYFQARYQASGQSR